MFGDWQRSGSELLSELREVERQRNLLLHRSLQLTAELHARGIAGDEGYASTIELVRDAQNLTKTQARHRVAAALDLIPSTSPSGAVIEPRLAQTATALAAGSVNEAQLTVIRQAVADVPAHAEQHRAGLEQRLAQHAHLLDSGQLRILGRRELAYLNQDGAPPADETVPTRSLTIRPIAGGGVRGEFVLDAEGAAALTAALSPLAAPRPTTATNGAATGGANDNGTATNGVTATYGATTDGARHDGTSTNGARYDGTTTNGGTATFGATLTNGTTTNGTYDGATTTDSARADGTATNGAATNGTYNGTGARDGATATTTATDGGRDRRTHAQRNADALVELATRALQYGNLPTERVERPQLLIKLDYDTLTRTVRTATLDGTGPIHPETARRFACDAKVIPMVLGSRSEPLDVGRRSYTVPTPMRRALIERDQGCAHPGCAIPWQWCDAHHIRSWLDGGATALHNLVLLCPAHHRQIHHSKWRIEMVDNYPVFHPPPWLSDAPIHNPLHRTPE
jgi:hypothetical protein